MTFNDKLVRIFFIFIGTLLVVGLFTIGFLLDDDTKRMYTSSPKPTKVTNISTDEKEVNLDTIFITIRADKYKILKADFAFKMKRESDKKALNKNMESVRNFILQHLASRDSNKLSTQKGKDELLEELKELMYEHFGYEIETIYIKNFTLSP